MTEPGAKEGLGVGEHTDRLVDSLAKGNRNLKDRLSKTRREKAQLAEFTHGLIREVAELRELARGVHIFGRPVVEDSRLTNYVIPASIWLHAERVIQRLASEHTEEEEAS